jgi:hypothetical protein
MSVLRRALVPAAVALGVVAYRMQIDNLGAATTPARSLAIVAVAWAFVGAGLAA